MQMIFKYIMFGHVLVRNIINLSSETTYKSRLENKISHCYVGLVNPNLKKKQTQK
eukprot:UN08555